MPEENEKPKKTTIKDLEQNIIEMAKAIKELAEDVKELKVVAPKPVPPAPAVSNITTSNTFPIPPEYRELVNTILNKNFGIEIEWMPAGFNVTIIVPEKYSPMTDKQKELIHTDKRTKLIPNFEGANGVRQWIDLIYNSFSTETKSLITNDR